MSTVKRNIVNNRRSRNGCNSTIGFEWAGKFIYPIPKGLNIDDKDAIAQMISEMPIAAFLWLLLGYAVGAFAGGISATILSGRKAQRPAITVGIILTIGGIINLTSIQHPFWFGCT